MAPSITVIADADGALPATAGSRLRRLHAYWSGLRAGDRLPAPRQVDPLALGDLLPWLFLVDHRDGRFRFRLVGEEVNRRYGWRLKGHSLEELLEGAALAEIRQEHEAAVTQRCAVFTRNTHASAHPGDYKRYQRLLLPLSSDGRSVDRLLGAMEFEH